MTIGNKIASIFSAFHDGTITKFSVDKDSLTLTVDCLYLAELINPRYVSFYIKIENLNKITLKTWPQVKGDDPKTFTRLDDIFQAELEILTAKVQLGNSVNVSCLQLDSSFDYSGGDLKISCSNISVLDQNENNLTESQLINLQKKYWSEKF